jgi:hypothetical protein
VLGDDWMMMMSDSMMPVRRGWVLLAVLLYLLVSFALICNINIPHRQKSSSKV